MPFAVSRLFFIPFKIVWFEISASPFPWGYRGVEKFFRYNALCKTLKLVKIVCRYRKLEFFGIPNRHKSLDFLFSNFWQRLSSHTFCEYNLWPLLKIISALVQLEEDLQCLVPIDKRTRDFYPDLDLLEVVLVLRQNVHIYPISSHTFPHLHEFCANNILHAFKILWVRVHIETKKFSHFLF